MRNAIGATVLCAALLVSGCSARQAAVPTDTSDAISPGVTEAGSGVEAVGILMYIDDGNGLFYALADEAEDPTSSSIPPLVAVLGNPEDVNAGGFTGQTVRVTGVRDGERMGVPVLHAESLSVLDSEGGLGSLEVPVPVTREVGIHALQDGSTQIVGEVMFFDTPGQRFWALRRPAESSRQAGVSFLAIVENPDDVGLKDHLDIVAVNGSLVESSSAPLGLPVLHAGEVVPVR